MAAIKAVFEESLSQTLLGGNLENVPVSLEEKEVIMNIVILKKNTIFFSLTVIDFSVITLFDSWHGATESFILVASLLNALMRDQTVKPETICRSAV